MKKYISQKEECLKRFEEFITKDININNAFWILDAILINYAQYIIQDENDCGDSREDSTQLYYIKLLRNIFIQPEPDGNI